MELVRGSCGGLHGGYPSFWCRISSSDTQKLGYAIVWSIFWSPDGLGADLTVDAPFTIVAQKLGKAIRRLVLNQTNLSG